MTLNELKYVIAVAQTQHFSKAAEVCHISQPSLSIAIKKFEQEMGLTLFKRGKRSVEVTPEGEAVIQQARKVLEEAEKLNFFKPTHSNQSKGVVKIGAIFTIGPYLFPSLVPYMREKHPDMPLHIDEDYSENLRRKLINAEIDIAVLALPFSDPTLETVAIYDEEFAPLFYDEHPFSDQATVDINDINSDELLMLGKGNCLRDQVVAACPNCVAPSASHDNWMVGSSLETIRHMVAMKLGISVMPLTALAKQSDYPGLDSRPFTAPAPKRRVILAWRSSYPRKQAVAIIAQSLQQALAYQVELLPLEPISD